MSKRTLDDTDYWGLDQGLDIEFVLHGSTVEILVNGKHIGNIMKMWSVDSNGSGIGTGIAIHFDHLINIETGVDGAMLIKVNKTVGDYIDLNLYGSQELTCENMIKEE